MARGCAEADRSATKHSASRAEAIRRPPADDGRAGVAVQPLSEVEPADLEPERAEATATHWLSRCWATAPSSGTGIHTLRPDAPRLEARARQARSRAPQAGLQ